jgi:hypothetical protein
MLELFDALPNLVMRNLVNWDGQFEPNKHSKLAILPSLAIHRSTRLWIQIDSKEKTDQSIQPAPHYILVASPCLVGASAQIPPIGHQG